MKRTNISVEEWQYEYLKERAEREETSMSALIREMVETYAKEEEAQRDTDVIHDVVGLGASGETGTARDHDRHLYRSQSDEGKTE